MLNKKKFPVRGKFFLKSPPKGPTRGFGNFAQNAGPWGGDFAVTKTRMPLNKVLEKKFIETVKMICFFSSLCRMNGLKILD